jgi:hypothetical protein
MFRHFSLLFEMRPKHTKQTIQDHIFLCNKVMDIFLQLGYHGDLMDEETWNNLLLILLGITDNTLRGKNGIVELGYGLLKVRKIIMKIGSF